MKKINGSPLGDFKKLMQKLASNVLDRRFKIET